MLLPFTKLDGGVLFIRAEDLRRIEDCEPDEPSAPPRCRLVWIEHDTLRTATVAGPASGVFAALKAEELARAEEHQLALRRAQSGLPAIPVPRGRPIRG
jgi:hypothetical protein